MTLKEEIRGHIAKGNIERAFEPLKNLTLSDSKIYNQCLLLEGTYRRIANLNINGTLSPEDYNRELSKIGYSVLALIEELDSLNKISILDTYVKQSTPTMLYKNAIAIVITLIISISTYYNIVSVKRVIDSNERSKDTVPLPLKQPLPTRSDSSFSSIKSNEKDSLDFNEPPSFKSETKDIVCKPCANTNNSSKWYVIITETPNKDGALNLVNFVRKKGFIKADIHHLSNNNNMVYADICPNKSDADNIVRCLKKFKQIDRGAYSSNHLPIIAKTNQPLVKKNEPNIDSSSNSNLVAKTTDTSNIRTPKIGTKRVDSNSVKIHKANGLDTTRNKKRG